MATSTSKILVGTPDRVTGAVMYAPLGTALPTTPIVAPNVAFVDLGYISEDGVTFSESLNWEQLYDWGGDRVRTFMTRATFTVKWAFLETNDDALKASYDATNVTITAATASTGKYTALKYNSVEPSPKAWLIHMQDTQLVDAPRKSRIVVTNGQITERGDKQYTRSGAILWPVTLECYPDSSGNSAYQYFTDGDYS